VKEYCRPADVAEIFRKHANAEKAREMEAYMKHHFSFFGIQKPLREHVCAPLYTAWKHKPQEELNKDIRVLWTLPERELHYFAMETLKKSKYWVNTDSLALFEWLVTHQSWWDTVDFIAAHLLGNYFLCFPEFKVDVTSRWISGPDMWLQRSALLFQLSYKKNTDFELLKKHILIHRSSKEFFIQKAMGWALRQYARTAPEEVRLWVKDQTLPALTVREALKHLH
jgi:3-methyladenine DNA glycosylase AlkD